jgi:hypothetical protein
MSSNTPPRSVLRSWRRHSLLRPRLTSRSGSTPSPFQAQSEISPGKNALLHRTAAGSTPLPPWSRELRGCLPARPGRQRLISGSCSSARGFDPRFLPTLGRPRAVALHFAHCDQFTAGLAPARVRPCWAHKREGGPSRLFWQKMPVKPIWLYAPRFIEGRSYIFTWAVS